MATRRTAPGTAPVFLAGAPAASIEGGSRGLESVASAAGAMSTAYSPSPSKPQALRARLERTRSWKQRTRTSCAASWTSTVASDDHRGAQALPHRPRRCLPPLPLSLFLSWTMTLLHWNDARRLLCRDWPSWASSPRRVHLDSLEIQIVGFLGRSGTPGKIRTYDIRLRRPTLYPAELRARGRGQHPYTARRGRSTAARYKAQSSPTIVSTSVERLDLPTGCSQGDVVEARGARAPTSFANDRSRRERDRVRSALTAERDDLVGGSALTGRP